MERYPNISDHGLIGDLQTAALVTTDGTVDWFCCPRFDSPSIFASLLDADKGGYFRISPATDKYVSKQLYFPDTAMLITRFMTEDGVGEVTDFMPIAGQQATDRHRLVRQMKVVRGTMRFVAEIKPRFDYGRAKHTARTLARWLRVPLGRHAPDPEPDRHAQLPPRPRKRAPGTTTSRWSGSATISASASP